MKRSEVKKSDGDSKEVSGSERENTKNLLHIETFIYPLEQVKYVKKN